MADSLLSIGTSGVLASNSLLQTTSNNISNINTPGYTRQRTEFDSSVIGLGVGQGTTSRLANDFASRQVRRDTSALYYYQQYQTEAARVDSLFSNTANNVSTGINSLFQQLQAANSDPANSSTRSLFMGSAQSLLSKFNTLSTLVLEQRTHINQQLESYVGEANGLINSVAKLNEEIAGYGVNGNSKPEALSLKDKRDETLRKLATLMDINTLEANNGETLVFTATGQSLILQQGKFNLLGTAGDPDPERKELTMQLDYKPSVLKDVEATSLGGKIGGLLKFRADMLEPTQNRLGQLAVALGDGINTQNKLGMDANGQIGKNIFDLGTYGGLPMKANTGAGKVLATIEPGHGKDMPANEFLVTYTAPNQFKLEAVDQSGAVLAGFAITQTIAGYPAKFNSTNVPGNMLYGMEITLDTTAGAFQNGDQFILKPLNIAAQTVSLLNNRPEDLALASPLRGDFTQSNLGNGRISSINVTDTAPATSKFTAPGGLAAKPYTIKAIAGDKYEIRDGANTLLGTTGALTTGQLNNMFAAAGLPNYGFDVSLSGVPKTGDTFTIDYNTNGYKDNRNGLALANLQSADLMRKTAVATAAADNKMTLNEGYAGMVSFIGEKASEAKISMDSSKALLDQSTAWKESISGVNLDEEAADLIRFQQSYAAAAKIIATSQTIFDTLLQAAR